MLLEDGNLFTSTSDAVTVTLDKIDPSGLDPRIYWTPRLLEDYSTNTGITNLSDSAIELGVTGSITFWTDHPDDSQGWRGTAGYPTQSSPTVRTVNPSNTPTNLEFKAYWDSNGLGSPTEFTGSDNNKGFSRITSLRYGALEKDVFTSYISPTNAELLDVENWINNSGSILFNTKSSSEIDEVQFDVEWSGDKYVYIIMDDSISLTQINIDGFGSISAFTTGTTTYYRS